MIKTRIKTIALFFVSTVCASVAHSQVVQTVNSLNKTGGTIASYIRVERCADGTLAVANDWNALTSQGVTNPCSANASQSNGMIKNIGTQSTVNFSVSNCSVYVGLNNITNGFHVMYQAGSNQVCTVAEMTSPKEYAGQIHKCLLLLKNKLASEIVVDTTQRSVTCDSK